MMLVSFSLVILAELVLVLLLARLAILKVRYHVYAKNKWTPLFLDWRRKCWNARCENRLHQRHPVAHMLDTLLRSCRSGIIKIMPIRLLTWIFSITNKRGFPVNLWYFFSGTSVWSICNHTSSNNVACSSC